MESFCKKFGKIGVVIAGVFALYALRNRTGANAQPPNIFKVAWYRAVIWTKSVGGCVVRNAKDLKFFAYATILLTTAVILVGVIVARSGHVDVGRGIMAVGGILAGVMSYYVYIRSAVLIGVLMAGSQAASGLTGGRVKKIEPEQAAAWLRGVATAGAWVTFVSLYLCFFPVYNDLVLAGITVVCFLFSAFVLSAEWTKYRTGSRTAAIIVGFSVLVIVTAANVFPAAKISMIGWHGIASSELTQWTGRHAAIEKAQAEAATKSARIDTVLLRQLNAAKQSLEWKYVNGGSWSDQDKLAYDGLLASIAAVEDGTYWEKMAEPKPAAAAQAPAPASAPSAATLNASAAPPNGVPPVAVAQTPAHDQKVRDELCTKYPHLCHN